MPTYEYRCKSCRKELEVVQSFTDDSLTECPTCRGPLRKVFGSIGITFKGSGFYKTDSRKGDSSAVKSESTGSSAEGSSSTGGSGDSGSSGGGESKVSKPAKESRPAKDSKTTTKGPSPSGPSAA